MKRYYEKYKHIIPLAIFGVIYVLWFYLLEHRTNVQYMVVHMNIDDYIPFCEYFVVPYLLWFAYVPAVLGYLFFKDRRNYDRCAVFLCTGMLIFLVISTFIPNIQHLRLHTMPRHNVFTVLVSQLWQTDTPTNLFPSIHVYNSLGAHFAVMNNETLSGKKWVRRGSSRSGRPYFSRPRAMLLTRKAIFRARVRMVRRPSASWAASPGARPWMLFQYWLEATGIPLKVKN